MRPREPYQPCHTVLAISCGIIFVCCNVSMAQSIVVKPVNSKNAASGANGPVAYLQVTNLWYLGTPHGTFIQYNQRPINTSLVAQVSGASTSNAPPYTWTLTSSAALFAASNGATTTTQTIGEAVTIQSAAASSSRNGVLISVRDANGTILASSKFTVFAPNSIQLLTPPFTMTDSQKQITITAADGNPCYEGFPTALYPNVTGYVRRYFYQILDNFRAAFPTHGQIPVNEAFATTATATGVQAGVTGGMVHSRVKE